METETIMETIINEYYVSLEVAKLLKEAGFDWETKNWWDYCKPIDEWSLRNYPEAPVNWNSKYYNYDCSAPTLDVAQRWLREVKGLIVQIDFLRHNKWWYLVLQGERVETLENPRVKFNTYEEAQEAGIRKALEIILEKGE